MPFAFKLNVKAPGLAVKVIAPEIPVTETGDPAMLVPVPWVRVQVLLAVTETVPVGLGVWLPERVKLNVEVGLAVLRPTETVPRDDVAAEIEYEVAKAGVARSPTTISAEERKPVRSVRPKDLIIEDTTTCGFRIYFEKYGKRRGHAKGAKEQLIGSGQKIRRRRFGTNEREYDA
jgi:hypothetical protein